MGLNLYENLETEARKLINSVSTPEEVGMFRIKSANQTIMEAAQRPDPKALYLSIWYEGEICCLFADSNLGKSILAVQIANEIAKTEKILYFDFELSDKQFQIRYTDNGVCYQFPPNFYRVDINREKLDGDFEEKVISDIEASSVQTGAKVLIVDNLTWLCSESEKGGDAAVLMQKLLSLKFKYGLSLLVIAHTPKRQLSSPISQNDLAGSKKLFNFFDSVFAIGRSAKDENLRYIKQVKCRYGSFTYDSDNVIVCQISQINSFTKFEFIGYSTEREHLKEQTDKDDDNLKQKIKELQTNGKSYRDIASELGISAAKVCRLLK
jgi:hypothetical protein